MFRFSRRSINRLVGVRPELVLVLSRALMRSPYDFAVSEGVRSEERQRMLYHAGKSQTLNSKHLTGRAVDIIAVGDLDGDGDVDTKDRSRTWDRAIYSAIAIAIDHAAHELGIGVRWGGTFRDFFDGPHFELI